MTPGGEAPHPTPPGPADLAVHIEPRPLPSPLADARNLAPLATGHQASLWHPGILAKTLAMSHWAHPPGSATPRATRLLIVDQDDNDALAFDAPLLAGETLSTLRIALGPQPAGVPTGCLPALPARQACDALAQAARDGGAPLAARLRPLREAFETEATLDLEHIPPIERSLAAQLMRVLRAALGPYAPSADSITYASVMLAQPQAQRFVEDMLLDADACANAYNAAANQFPDSGIAPLNLRSDAVELPLWWLRPGATRLPVYASDRRLFAGRAQPGLPAGLENSRFDDLGPRLAPRALLLTALARRTAGAIFIHGRGGAAYDRVTESWLQRWRGESLPPTVMVTADLRPAWGVPLAQPTELARALWRRHHLPHNLDRALSLEGDPVTRKHAALHTLAHSTDRAARRHAFDELLRINAALQSQHADALELAEREVLRCRRGLANLTVARRRDWPAPLLPPSTLEHLKLEVTRAAS